MDADLIAILMLLFVLFAALQFAVDEWVMGLIVRWFGGDE